MVSSLPKIACTATSASRTAVCARSEKPVRSPQTYTLATEVCILLSTSTLPRSVSCKPRFSKPKPLLTGRRPTLINSFSATTLPAPSAFSYATTAPSSLWERETTLVLSRNLIPRLAYSARRRAESSLSIPPNISSNISMTVTCTPRLLKKEANSIPITPPPTIASEAGSSLLSSASRCVQ